MSAQFIPVEPFDLVVFGGTGDLALRKLLPGLLHRDGDQQLQADSRIIAVARSELDRDGYRALVAEALERHVGNGVDAEVFARFMRRLHYHQLDALNGDWTALGERLADHPERVRVVYLATAPALFGPICARLGANGLDRKSVV